MELQRNPPTHRLRPGADPGPRRRRGPSHRVIALAEQAATLPGARRARTLGFIAPMLTTAAKGVPDGDDWLHEWKWDGYRLIAAVGVDASARLWSRNGLAWEARVPEIVAALRGLGTTALLDGELIAVDARGNSDFNALQHALKHAETVQLRYAAFDLMRVADVDLTGVALTARKALLQQLLAGADSRLFYSGHLQGQGGDMFEQARERRMEGIISKRADSLYRSGRSTDWLKIKAVETREFVVVGYTAPKGSRQGIGALLLAQLRRGKLVYAGRVGSGLSDTVLAELPRTLQGLAAEAPTVPLPAHTPLPPGKVKWVRPQLVAEVVFRGWGKEGLLRQASFLRIRPDRAPSQDLAQQTPLPNLTSPTRIVFPDIGATKQQVYDYYLAVGERLLSEIGGRLLSIVRCPAGIAGPRFFQKHAGPGFGEAVRRLRIREADGDEKDYFYVEDVAGLMNLVQMNAIEMHPWGSSIQALERPDRLVFDLDPDPAVGWPQVRRAAVDVHDGLAELGLPSWPRLSGGKGVHVVVPLRPKADWDAVREFCGTFAQAMAQRHPSRYVATMSKAKREGRIFIDWLRNSRGATSVAGWSLRARAGAPAAVPLSWEELTRVRRPDRFSLRDAATRDLPAFIPELIAKAPPLPTRRG